MSWLNILSSISQFHNLSPLVQQYANQKEFMTFTILRQRHKREFDFMILSVCKEYKHPKLSKTCGFRILKDFRTALTLWFSEAWGDAYNDFAPVSCEDLLSSLKPQGCTGSAGLNMSPRLQEHSHNCSLQACILQGNGAQSVDEGIHQSVITSNF